MTRSALVIDDEPDVTTFLAALLGDHGWEVRTANDAGSGLELAREAPPDVVLLDVMMPDRGGMSTLVALRKEAALASTRVILVTGIQHTLNQDFEAYLHRFKHYHPDGYLEKPVDPDTLLALLNRLVAAGADATRPN
jgi:DNA-binding response OmpR family regulator